MKNSHFIQLLKSQFNLSDNGEQLLQHRIKKMLMPKGAPLLRPGEICRHIYFLESGFLRLYTENEEQQTTDFSCQGHFCAAMESLLNQSESEEGIICETDTKLYALHYYDLMVLEELSLEFVLLSKKLLSYYFLRLNQEKKVYLKGNATEKFNYVCQHYPGLVAHVKNKDMASYLGITQQSFSRMLKENLTKG
ncbi:Crp/Fnr family transcriptional regulator [Pedobacter ureilyticus]|jgi:CRP-like cAMP-binding protein|uniref:Crp/Fnr family transcriptional regulator n=1 Tax=Pedobacter ureilyticus TaxID=1393051 RepID=A0ABW9J393_9SPHI|nr:Crp/Fnr family transcriptional regulator [Pedobacter helvus]